MAVKTEDSTDEIH